VVTENISKQVNFAARLAEYRELLGLSRAELALVLDVTARTVQNWETGYCPVMAFLAVKALYHRLGGECGFVR